MLSTLLLGRENDNMRESIRDLEIRWTETGLRPIFPNLLGNQGTQVNSLLSANVVERH
jgi:hypothetical protein